jgi:addiction module RelE/StbE family toxin
VKARSYRVEWAEVAKQDLLAIVDYLAARNPDAAMSLLDTMERRAASLKTSPGRDRVIPELERLQLREYRELVISPYRLLYRVAGHRVLVLGVLDSRRNLQDLLLDRLIGDR